MEKFVTKWADEVIKHFTLGMVLGREGVIAILVVLLSLCISIAMRTAFRRSLKNALRRLRKPRKATVTVRTPSGRETTFPVFPGDNIIFVVQVP